VLSSSNPLVLIGTYTEPQESKSEGVYVYRLDRATGELRYESVIKDMPNVSFMAVHPISGLIYAVNETEEFNGKPGGGVSVLARDADGNFRVIHKQSSGGISPCYISIEKTGRYALVANYESGSVAMLPIGTEGQLLPHSDLVQHIGSSVHPERQSGPHAHCILPDPSNCFAIAVDLGLDKLFVYRMDLESGKLQKHTEVEVDAGAGPRHLIFNSTRQYAYLLNELNSTLNVYRYDSQSGTLTQLQTVPTLPDDFSGENFCGDLCLSPDDKYLYASNRGHDSIVCFHVASSTGQLSHPSYIASGGHYPRILALDPSGRFMIAVHQKSHNVVVFKIDPETGNLFHTGHEAKLSMPVHVLFPKG
jgi:6-phosphogluconolactonase